MLDGVFARDAAGVVVSGAARQDAGHMANPQGRVFPLAWEEFDYAWFFARLRQIGHAGRGNVEASSKGIPAEGPQATALLWWAFVEPK